MIVSIVPMGTISASAVSAATVKKNLDSFISNYPSGSRWTGTFDGGSQCYGFGKMVIYNIFGKNSSGGYRSWNYSGISTSGMKTIGSITSFSASNVQSLLSKARCGDVLQFDQTKQHTMIVYSVDSTGVTIYDCNWDNNCGISKRHSSFGAWAGRNSAKLTLLRSDNSEEPVVVTHTIDSKYSKNFTAYPKAKITASNIFDANHNQISSTAWIGTTDKCTINEVYTDGCCKVTYPLDGGGTKTAYSKISLFTMPTYTVKYSANGGSGAPSNQTKTDGTYLTLSSTKPTRTGYTFTGWGESASSTTVAYSSGTTYKNNKNVTLYALWTPNKLSVNYNANGGTITSDTYKLSNNIIYTTSNNTKFAQVWTYNEKRTNGLYNAKTFGLTREGYTFKGWGTTASGGTVFDQDDSTLVPTSINSSIKNGNCTTTLYAIWEKIPATVSSISIQSKPTKTTYMIGGTFSSSGLSIKVNMSDGTSKTVTSGFTLSSPDMSTAGTKTVTVTYQGKTTSFTVTVQTPSISVSSTSKTMTVGDTVTLTAITTPSGQTVIWTSSNTSVASVSNGVVTAKASGTAIITAKFTYNGSTYSKTCNFTVNNPPATVSSIAVQSKPTKTVYTVGEAFNSSGLSIKVNMSDGTSKTVTSGFTVSSPDMTTAGTKTVTVTYQGKTTTFTIAVNPKAAQNDGTIKIESLSAAVGKTVQIPVYVENADLSMLNITVNYDKTKLKYISNSNEVFDLIDVNSSTAGKITFACISDKGISSGKILILTFEVIAGDAGNTQISVNVNDAYNSQEKVQNLSVVNGTVKITKGLLGDVNSDGKVNIIDARWLLQVSSGNRTLTPEQKAVADVNGDGKINIIDARWLLQVSSGNRTL